jgi:hypothetical protein
VSALLLVFRSLLSACLWLGSESPNHELLAVLGLVASVTARADEARAHPDDVDQSTLCGRRLKHIVLSCPSAGWWANAREGLAGLKADLSTGMPVQVPKIGCLEDIGDLRVQRASFPAEDLSS